MFWKFDLHTTSHIDALLEKDGVTLAELMDEDDVLQECKAQNRKLVDFLVQPQAMEELVQLITLEPANSLEEKTRYKYPNVACELLTADVSQINDKLGEDEALLGRLYAFLEQSPPLNPLLASFFSKIMGILITRKTEQIIQFLQKREDFVGLLLKHIGTSAIMDLLLRLLTCVDPPKLKQDVLAWLNEQRLIQRLIDLIHVSQHDDRHSNASQSLCDIIRLSREQIIPIQENPEPDPLLTTLEKEETIKKLVGNMFDGEKNESALVNGIQVLLTLLETKRAGPESQMDMFPPGVERPGVPVSSSTLNGVRARLKDFHTLLLDPPKKGNMMTTVGLLDPPLGNTRLHVAKLVNSLLQANSSQMNQALQELDTIAILLDLFFKYMWNNFLHYQVEQVIVTILTSCPECPDGGDCNLENGSNGTKENALVKYLFDKCCLVQRILDAWTSNETEQSSGGRRRGYMGHLTRIANCVVQSMDHGANEAHIKILFKGGSPIFSIGKWGGPSVLLFPARGAGLGHHFSAWDAGARPSVFFCGAPDLPDDYKERWESFVSGSLTEINKKNTVDLVSPYNQHSSSEDDDTDIKDIGFPHDASLQQAFSDYQMQQMTSNFVDQFGFSDEEFAEQEDNVNASFDRVSEINFAINASDDSQNAALFEAACNERIQQFDDVSADDEDIWDNTQTTSPSTTKVRSRFGVLPSPGIADRAAVDSGNSEDSTESDEEDCDGVERASESKASVSACNATTTLPVTDEKMDIDTSDGSQGWMASFDDVPMETTGPSGSMPRDGGSGIWLKTAEGVNSTGTSWAVFPDVESATRSSGPMSGPRSSSPVAMETGPDTTSQASKHVATPSRQPTNPSSSSTHAARPVPTGVSSDDENSSSGGSDSDEAEGNPRLKVVLNKTQGGTVITETITSGSMQETLCLSMDAKSETAVFKRCKIFRSTCRCSSEVGESISSEDVPITEMSLSSPEPAPVVLAASVEDAGVRPVLCTNQTSSPPALNKTEAEAKASPLENGPLEGNVPELESRPEQLSSGDSSVDVST
uniref:serine/threonine-protein phosphatase 6 regulatory subunit 3-like isoform X4 n=1 Tax=Myxine glutinosa TaxID=7769 RepID=UPI00358FA564